MLGVVLAILILVLAYAFYEPHSWTKSVAPAQLTRQQKLDAAINAAKVEVQNARTPSDKAQANEALGAAYMNADQTNSAIDAYNRAIAADSSVKPEALDSLAYAYAVSGQRQKAIVAYQELIQLQEAQPIDSEHFAQQYTGSAVQKYQRYIEILQNGGSL